MVGIWWEDGSSCSRSALPPRCSDPYFLAYYFLASLLLTYLAASSLRSGLWSTDMRSGLPSRKMYARESPALATIRWVGEINAQTAVLKRVGARVGARARVKARARVRARVIARVRVRVGARAGVLVGIRARGEDVPPDLPLQLWVVSSNCASVDRKAARKLAASSAAVGGAPEAKLAAAPESSAAAAAGAARRLSCSPRCTSRWRCRCAFANSDASPPPWPS